MPQDQGAVVDYFLKAGHIFIHQGPTLVRTVLGSAVAVTLWNRRQQLGGINHFLFPRTHNRREATARYGNVAMLALIAFLHEENVPLEHLEAQIFGGASPNPPPAEDVGPHNITLAREILAKKGIPVISEDVGGFLGRKLIYNLATNEVIVIKVENLRASDWFPYEDRI